MHEPKLKELNLFKICLLATPDAAEIGCVLKLDVKCADENEVIKKSKTSFNLSRI